MAAPRMSPNAQAKGRQALMKQAPYDSAGVDPEMEATLRGEQGRMAKMSAIGLGASHQSKGYGQTLARSDQAAAGNGEPHNPHPVSNMNVFSKLGAMFNALRGKK